MSKRIDWTRRVLEVFPKATETFIDFVKLQAKDGIISFETKVVLKKHLKSHLPLPNYKLFIVDGRKEYRKLIKSEKDVTLTSLAALYTFYRRNKREVEIIVSKSKESKNESKEDTRSAES